MYFAHFMVIPKFVRQKSHLLRHENVNMLNNVRKRRKDAQQVGFHSHFRVRIPGNVPKIIMLKVVRQFATMDIPILLLEPNAKWMFIILKIIGNLLEMIGIKVSPKIPDFQQKNRFLTKILIGDQNFGSWRTFRFMTKISVFDQYFGFRAKFRLLPKFRVFTKISTYISISDQIFCLTKISIFNQKKMMFNLRIWNLGTCTACKMSTTQHHYYGKPIAGDGYYECNHEEGKTRCYPKCENGNILHGLGSIYCDRTYNIWLDEKNYRPWRQTSTKSFDCNIRIPSIFDCNKLSCKIIEYIFLKT